MNLPTYRAGSLILLASLFALPALSQAPRLNQWKVIGPGGGGTMIAPTISPLKKIVGRAFSIFRKVSVPSDTKIRSDLGRRCLCIGAGPG
jgi:hypothetical protein